MLWFQDLIETCVKYMKMNIVSASQQNYLIAWLQYTLTCGHSDISSVCLNHFKWNLEQVATHEDFASCDLDLLTTVLAEHDVVVHDEMTLYKWVMRGNFLKGLLHRLQPSSFILSLSTLPPVSVFKITIIDEKIINLWFTNSSAFHGDNSYKLGKCMYVVCISFQMLWWQTASRLQ